MNRAPFLAILLVLTMFPGAGRAAPPAPAADGARALGAFNRWASTVPTLQGGGEARISAPGARDRGFRFSLAAARPDRARLQGRFGNLTVVFDLATADGAWTLLLPRDRKFVRSEAAGSEAGLILPPSEMVAVLLPAPLAPEEIAARGALGPESGGFRVVAPPSANPGRTAHRVVFLDARGRPTRLELRRESQLEAPFLVVRYDDWRRAGDTEFPFLVLAESPETGEQARFAFETVKPGPDLDRRRFSILVPPGTREIPLEELTPDFLPEVEGTR